MSDLASSLRRPLAHRVAAHRYSQAQLVAIDAIAVAVTVGIYEFLMPRSQPQVLATAWQSGFWVACAVAGLALLFRRRWPRSVLAVVVVIAVVALSCRVRGPFTFFVALAVYSAAMAIPRQAMRVLAGLLACVILVATAVGGGDQRAQASVAGVVLVLLGWLAAENTRASRAYARQQAERAAEKAAAAEAERAEQVQRALTRERAEIARELHDIVAHAMSVIAVRSGVARMVIDDDPQQAREALGIIETTTRRSLQEMRLLIGVLRADGDDEVALRPAPGLGDLGQIVTDAAAAGVTVDVHTDGDVRSLPPAADLSAYRIVQEALTNVARHAGPTRAQVKILYGPNDLGIEVTDEGPAGHRPPAPLGGTAQPAGATRTGSGHGLIGMRERVALFGGELTAGPGPRGFRVAASLRTTENVVAPASEVASLPAAEAAGAPASGAAG